MNAFVSILQTFICKAFFDSPRFVRRLFVKIIIMSLGYHICDFRYLSCWVICIRLYALRFFFCLSNICFN